MQDPRRTYEQALATMRQVVVVLRDEPDQDGEIAQLIGRIEGEREWLLVNMINGRPPRRPPSWVWRKSRASVS